uniref:Putative secreted protein salivary gland overexpressed n=1 Tax=Rhipicephalus microplus TaxID=6941 RepID=A0A6M2D1M0_RHIMP
MQLHALFGYLLLFHMIAFASSGNTCPKEKIPKCPKDQRPKCYVPNGRCNCTCTTSMKRPPGLSNPFV